MKTGAPKVNLQT